MPATMAKKAKQNEGGSGPEEEGRQGRNKHKLVGLRLPKPIRSVVEGLAKRERRSVAQMSAILVEEALTARGLWTPPMSEDTGAAE
jgi:type II secretory pathway component PulM